MEPELRLVGLVGLHAGDGAQSDWIQKLSLRSGKRVKNCRHELELRLPASKSGELEVNRRFVLGVGVDLSLVSREDVEPDQEETWTEKFILELFSEIGYLIVMEITGICNKWTLDFKILGTTTSKTHVELFPVRSTVLHIVLCCPIIHSTNT